MNTAAHKCISCGAALNFDISTQKWICNYCKKEYNLEDLKKNIQQYENIKTNNFEIFECSNCGAKVLGDDSISATKCVYCGSSVIIKKRLENEYKPDYIITFKHDEDEIKNLLSKKLKSKFFCDSKFGDITNIKEINRLYVPYWLLSCEVMASIKGILYIKSDDYTVNKVCMRLGAMHFDRVPADAKSNLDDQLLQGIEPFNYDELIPFEYPYLAGMLAECYDEDENEIIKNQIKKRIEEAVEDKLMKTISGANPETFGVHERSTFIKKDKFEYVLVPIWFIKLEYKDKIYEFCVNDQTKKISGIKQINGIKVALAYLFLSIFSLLSVYIILNNGIVFSELIFYLVIFLLIVLFGILSSHILSYKKVVKGKASHDYISKGSFKLLDASDNKQY